MSAALSFAGRAQRWARLSWAAKLRWLAVKLSPSRVFGGNDIFQLSFPPVSQSHFGSHPEHLTLFSRFTNGSRWNAPDGSRLWAFILNIKEVMADGIPGDFAELGVHRGNTAAVLWHYAKKHDRNAYLFDTFEGFDARDLQGVDASRPVEFADTSMEIARRIVGADADGSEGCIFVKGYFPDSLKPEHGERTYAVVSIDCDLYAPALSALEFFYARMPVGGIFFIHDYSSGWWPGLRAAVREFCAKTGEQIVLLPDNSGSVVLRKSFKTGAPGMNG